MVVILILSDRLIRAAIINEQIKIEPFNEENLRPVSYDLTVGNIFEFMGEVPMMKDPETWLEPHTLYGIETMETIGVKDLTGFISIRSWAARQGIFASYSHLVDPGYLGKLTFTILPKLTRVLCKKNVTSMFQILFLENSLIDKLWEGDSKHF